MVDLWYHHGGRSALVEGSNGMRMYPKPTTDVPDEDTLAEWTMDSVCEATDGCEVELDGICSHGFPSWLIRLNLI